MKDDVYQAWRLGEFVSEYQLGLGMLERGCAYPDDPVEQRSFLGILDRTAEFMDDVSILLAQLGIHGLEPSPEQVKISFGALPRTGSLSKEQLESVNHCGQWDERIQKILYNQSIDVACAYVFASFLRQEHFLFSVFTGMTPGKYDKSLFFFSNEYAPRQISPSARLMLAASLGKADWELINWSLERWRTFRAAAGTRAIGDAKFLLSNAREINFVINDQVEAWENVITGEKHREDFLTPRQRVGLYMIPITIATASLAAAFGGLIALIPRISSSALTAIGIIIGGGLAAALLNLLWFPVKALTERARERAIRKSFLKLPSCSRDLRYWNLKRATQQA